MTDITRILHAKNLKQQNSLIRTVQMSLMSKTQTAVKSIKKYVDTQQLDPNSAQTVPSRISNMLHIHQIE